MDRTRRSAGSSSRRIDTATGYSANDIPCITRPTISRAGDDVSAPSSEPARIRASAPSSTHFLLNRSASRPMSRGSRRGGQQVGRDRPFCGGRRDVQLCGHQVQDGHDAGLQHGGGQHDSTESRKQAVVALHASTITARATSGVGRKVVVRDDGVVRRSGMPRSGKQVGPPRLRRLHSVARDDESANDSLHATLLIMAATSPARVSTPTTTAAAMARPRRPRRTS